MLGLFLPPHPLPPTTIVRYTWVHAVGGGGGLELHKMFNTILTKKNTVLAKFNTVLTKKNTVLAKFNTVLAKFNTVLTKKHSRVFRHLFLQCKQLFR